MGAYLGGGLIREEGLLERRAYLLLTLYDNFLQVQSKMFMIYVILLKMKTN